MSGLSNRGYRKNSPNFDAYYSKLNNALNSSVTDITSRDQIINPYDIVDRAFYGISGRSFTQYEEDLNALLAIQAQQEASFEDYYNSPEQQAVRQRAAGLNPDLLGVESSPASSANQITSSPIEGEVPLSTKISEVGSSVASLVSQIGSLAVLPSSIKSMRSQMQLSSSQVEHLTAQTDFLGLQNINSFESSAYNALGAKLADAVSSAASGSKQFDFDEWLSQDHSDVFRAYAPDGVSLDNPRYSASWNRVLRNIELHKRSAYDISGKSISAQTEFARALADPYFDNDLLTQIAYLEPVLEAMKELDALTRQYNIATMTLKGTYVSGIDGELASQSFNDTLKASIAKAGFDTDYFEGFNGDEKAAYELALLKSQQIISACESTIKSHYLSIWNDSSKPFTARAGAMYQIMGGTSAKWQEWLVSYFAANGITNSEGVSVFQDPKGFIDGTTIGKSLQKLGENLYDLQ